MTKLRYVVCAQATAGGSTAIITHSRYTYMNIIKLIESTIDQAKSKHVLCGIRDLRELRVVIIVVAVFIGLYRCGLNAISLASLCYKQGLISDTDQ